MIWEHQLVIILDSIFKFLYSRCSQVNFDIQFELDIHICTWKPVLGFGIWENRPPVWQSAASTDPQSSSISQTLLLPMWHQVLPIKPFASWQWLMEGHVHSKTAKLLRPHLAPIAIKAATQLLQQIPVTRWGWMRNEHRITDCFNPVQVALWEAWEAT